MATLEDRYVIEINTDLLGIGLSLTGYIVGKPGVDASSLFNLSNIDFFTETSLTDLNRLRSSNFNLIVSNTVTYDISNASTEASAPAKDPLTKPYYDLSQVQVGSLTLNFSAVIDNSGSRQDAPFPPLEVDAPYPYDLEFSIVIDTPNGLSTTFGDITQSNTIFRYYYAPTTNSIEYNLNFDPLTGSTLDPAIPLLNANQYSVALLPTLSVNQSVESVIIPPQTVNRFSLGSLFAYNRAYLPLNNQTKFETYEFLITRNKLKHGARTPKN